MKQPKLRLHILISVLWYKCSSNSERKQGACSPLNVYSIIMMFRYGFFSSGFSEPALSCKVRKFLCLLPCLMFCLSRQLQNLSLHFFKTCFSLLTWELIWSCIQERNTGLSEVFSCPSSWLFGGCLTFSLQIFWDALASGTALDLCTIDQEALEWFYKFRAAPV